jgi:hypothetical protein
VTANLVTSEGNLVTKVVTCPLDISTAHTADPAPLDVGRHR